MFSKKFKSLSMSLMIITATVSALSCKKKEEDTAPSTNMAAQVVANLNSISQNYAPSSMEMTSRGHGKTDPCFGVTDFAVCQSYLVREYLSLGKVMVELLASMASGIGQSLGEIPDGNSGTSSDNKISWSKTDGNTWAVLLRGTGGQSNAHFSIAPGVYSLKVDGSVSESNPSNMQIEATVNFTDESNWTVDVFFVNGDCDASDVGAPSKAEIKLSYTGSLWTGKAMIYSPRWEAPGTTVTCSTPAGTQDLAMYTDFVGNNDSTKAALYLIPSSVSSLATISNYSIPNFCTNFSSFCGGAGQPTSGLLTGYTNNWCSASAGAAPTWGNDCTSNTAVSGASYSSSSNWVVPSSLKTKSVTLPTTP